MDIKLDWTAVRKHFNLSFRSNFHVSIASVDSGGLPTVTPIGSFFLNDDLTGFYFEKYPTKLPLFAKSKPNICILAVNSSRWFWLKSLFKGKFEKYPAVKLYGELMEKRNATEKEIFRLNRRMRATKTLRGNKYLWGHMKYIREIKFTKVEKINLGKMTKNL